MDVFKHKRKSENGHKTVKIAMVVSIIAILFSVVCVKTTDGADSTNSNDIN